jgi:hypothetical protein
MGPWGGCRYSLEPEVFIKICVGVFGVSPAPETVLTAQVNPNPFFGVVLQVGEGFGAVHVIEVVRPPPERHVESRNDRFLRQSEVSPARCVLNLFLDAA